MLQEFPQLTRLCGTLCTFWENVIYETISGHLKDKLKHTPQAEHWIKKFPMLFNLYNTPMKGTLLFPFYKPGNWVSEKLPSLHTRKQKYGSMCVQVLIVLKQINQYYIGYYRYYISGLCPVSLPPLPRSTFFHMPKIAPHFSELGEEKIEFKWVKLVKYKTIKCKLLNWGVDVNMLFLIMAWWWHKFRLPSCGVLCLFINQRATISNVCNLV